MHIYCHTKFQALLIWRLFAIQIHWTRFYLVLVPAAMYASRRECQRSESLKAAHEPTSQYFTAVQLTTHLCCFPTFFFLLFFLKSSQMAFFSQHGCTTNAANAKYNSRAAKLYREKIKTLATQATRRQGTEVLQTSCSKWPNFMKGPFYTYLLFCPRQKQGGHIA